MRPGQEVQLLGGATNGGAIWVHGSIGLSALNYSTRHRSFRKLDQLQKKRQEAEGRVSPEHTQPAGWDLFVQSFPTEDPRNLLVGQQLRVLREPPEWRFSHFNWSFRSLPTQEPGHPSQKDSTYRRPC